MKTYVHTETYKYAASGNGVLAVWQEKLFSDHAWEDEVQWLRFTGVERNDCPGAQSLYFIHSQVVQLHPTVEEIQLCLHQAPNKDQGPQILCYWFSPCQSSVQFSLCSHIASLVSVSGCRCAAVPRSMFGPACRVARPMWLSDSHLGALLGAQAWAHRAATPTRLLWSRCKHISAQRNRQTVLPREAFVKLWLPQAFRLTNLLPNPSRTCVGSSP